jgi:beta-lactamase regulating signal transducer with metallopeptidase domain
MSISASYIVLAVLLLRFVFKKAPKWISVVLWGIVAVRLICPFSFESIFSLIPSAETVSPYMITNSKPQIDTGVSIINNTLNPIISEFFRPAPGDSAYPLQIWIPILAVIWIVGIAVLLGYTVISYIRVKRRIGTAMLLKDQIYQSEFVISPFVLGLIKPKVYLPLNMNEKDMAYVVAHEQAHIRRKDHLWKPLGFLLLTLHWFNPLMWLGYILLCRDIELACDEKVIKELDRNARADYSQALLTCSVNRRMIAVCPLAFGEVGVKDRVKYVLNYKRPAFWIMIVAIVLCVVLAVCFLTNPEKIDDYAIDLNETAWGSQLITLPISKHTAIISIEDISYIDDIDIELLKTADRKINRKILTYSDKPFFILAIDKEGYLCLKMETIRKIKSDNPLEGGCGIDHEHIFYSERISSYPVETKN